MKGFIVLALLVASVTLAVARAPLLHADAERVVPDQYIIVLNENATVEIRDHHVSLLSKVFGEGERILNTFDIGSFIGFSAVLSKATLERQLEEPVINYIEADQVVSLYDTTVTQTGATWGINRISTQRLQLDGYYRYWQTAGTGVFAYIIDTGILPTHNEFGGRASALFNAITGESGSDLNGHGTHVAGTVGGKTYGVAKNVNLVGVKVLNAQGSGTNTGVISGVDWVTKHHQGRGASARSCANMSLGGGASSALDSAIANSIAAGIIYALAAGNDNANACNYSPARVATGITVGATTNTDARASYSNYGTCVTCFAPGSSITSSWIGSNTATSSISGTSMATPHVAGALAVYLGHTTAAVTPAQAKTWLRSVATPSVVTNPGTGSPNVLLFSPFSDV